MYEGFYGKNQHGRDFSPWSSRPAKSKQGEVDQTFDGGEENRLQTWPKPAGMVLLSRRVGNSRTLDLDYWYPRGRHPSRHGW